MNQSNLAMAEAYYSAVLSGDYDKVGSYLHSDVEYIDRLWPATGKDQVWPTAKAFASAVNQLNMVARFSNDDQVMLVCDVDWKQSETLMRTAVLITFSEGLIKRIELIYDPSQHMDICTGIFSATPGRS